MNTKPSYSSDFKKRAWSLPFTAGRRQKAAREFTLWGLPFLIPAVYRFQQGIVFDLFVFPDADRMRDFYETYGPLEDSLSPAALRKLEGEHPCPSPAPREIRINGLPAEEWDAQSFLYMNWAPEKNSPKKLLEKTYGAFLRHIPCFSCQRFRVPFPKSLRKTGIQGRLFPSRVLSLSMDFSPREGFLPLELEFPLDETAKNGGFQEFTFSHPKTGALHTLYLQKAPPEKLPGQDLWSFPVAYETVPPLREGEELCFDSSVSIPKKGEDFSPDSSAAASIGILGGADGPTALFLVSSKCYSGPSDGPSSGPHGLPLRYAFTRPAERPAEAAYCVLSGIACQTEKERTVTFSY